MNIISQIKTVLQNSLKELYGQDIPAKELTVSTTKPEFEGDYTVVMFTFIKLLKKSPEQIGNELGKNMVSNHPGLFKNFNVIKGFLNFSLSDEYLNNFLWDNYNKENFGLKPAAATKVIVEYSSPNTNKPLHLGHLRNNFLGWSVAEILKASGHETIKTCIVNDRGIHICKSMLAWQKYANGATPGSTSIKGDHFVGDYYVMFEVELKKQAQPIIECIMQNNLEGFEGNDLLELQKLLPALTLVETTKDKEKIEKIKDNILEIARNNTPVMTEAKEMLRKWEAGDEEVYDLWKRMNGWVYDGFEVTYKRIGSDFDKIYYESETYLPGKKFVEEGLKKGVFFKKEDGSVWIDLSSDGLDEKLVLRKDGTSVYITQDLGLAQQKYEDFKYDQSIYVIGDEQNYYVKVLKLIMQKLGVPYADGIHHLSYGMVELPSGRMKSREGTVVDADELVDEMILIAARHTEDSGKIKDFTGEELKELYDIIGLGALKFFLLRVDPKKRIIFNPEESIDFHGFTGPFIQYTHARIKSILRKENRSTFEIKGRSPLLPLEKELIIFLEQYPSIIEQAGEEHNPSALAIYIFNVAKLYNAFYTEHSVMNAESDEKKQLRLQLCQMTAIVIASAMRLLGIRVPERM